MPDYDFTQTRSQLVERALRLVGALSLGEATSGEAMNQGVTALNAVIKSWQSDHVFLWSMMQSGVTLNPGMYVYDLAGLDPPIITIDGAWLLDSAQNATPLERLSFRDYQQMVDDKQDSSEPTHFAVDNQRDVKLYVYPMPDKAYNLQFLAVTKLKDWDDAGGDGDFPVRWLDALTYGLAANLGDEYGIPIGERQSLGQKAQMLYKDAKRGTRDHSDEEFVRGAFG